MYNNYFGFREKPFKLVPNPEYLFLSKTHEIALAHLTFAAEQGDGFVVIIGEVGTGKTTLCRNYLESLDNHTDSAYIFNPHLDSNELLAGICHEFGMRTQEKGAKALLDILNEFLITRNAAGRKVMLLIDEAQMLSTENLEMVRMLSNLETTRYKLLQIILVGQPELANKLDTYELRQLAQRISLNYHLSPLSEEDTEAYIQHRIGIASKRYSQLFTKDATKLAYRYSKGVPRLINIVCDRALLVAFSHDKTKVDKTAMITAISEIDVGLKTLTASDKPESKKLRWVGVAVLLVIAAAAVLYLLSGNFNIPFPRVGKSEPVDQAASDAAATKATIHKVPTDGNSGNSTSTAASEDLVSELPTEVVGAGGQESPGDQGTAANSTRPSEKSPRRSEFTNLLAGLDANQSRKICTTKLLSLWKQGQTNLDIIPDEVDDSSFFDLAARQYGLRNYEVRGNWALVSKIGLPAIVTLAPPGQDVRVFMNLVGQKGDTMQLSKGDGGKVYEMDTSFLRAFSRGAIHVFWKNIIGFDMIIGHGSDQRAILMVKNLLRKIGYDHIVLTPEFDYNTRLAIRDFQERHQLQVDGLVGPLTKIMLLRQAGTAGMPNLNSDTRTDS